MSKQIVVAIVASLVVPASAGAHVTLQPEQAPAGGFARMDVRVPNERDNAGTTKVTSSFRTGSSSCPTSRCRAGT